MLGMVLAHQQRHLMRAERALVRHAIDRDGTRPAFWRTQHDHWPARARGITVLARILLDRADLRDHRFHRRGHALVHRIRGIALDEMRRPAIAAQELLKLVMVDTREDRRAVDLVAIEMEDRQHRAVGDRVQELV
jgi:hypothetical protein